MTAPPRFALVQLDRLLPHEEIDPDRVKRLSKEIREDEMIYSPVIVDESTNVILDGHHRFHALRELGCRLAPCHLVDYMDPMIRVEAWEDGRPIDKPLLIKRGLSGDLLPAKTTRHRTLKSLPSKPTPIAHLRPREERR